MTTNPNTTSSSWNKLSLETPESGIPTTTREHPFDKVRAHYDIVPPQTVEEFRECLPRVIFCLEDPKTGERFVYVQGCSPRAVPVASLDDLGDIYKLTGKGWHGDWSAPCVAPLADLTKDVCEYMRETGQLFSSDGLFCDPSNWDYFPYVSSSLHAHPNPCWAALDSKIWREWFGIMLGNFSGYRWDFTQDEEAA
jgi:hypothetical protein